jgi:nucleoid-associated protein YgaU
MPSEPQKTDLSEAPSGGASTASTTATGKPLPEPVPELKTYTVEPGDNLRSIAERFYGDTDQWQRVYEANKDRLNNPDPLSPGQFLVIPK